MKRMIVLCLAAVMLAMTGCGNKSAEEITVASEMADCVGVAPMKCLLIKEKGADSWSYWYSGIEGFNYEPGYEYVLKVEKVKVEHPAADASSLKYVLKKVVSKTAKTSEGMPH